MFNSLFPNFLPGFRPPTVICNVQCFTTNAIWVRPANTFCVSVIAVGGGGGGGGGAAASVGFPRNSASGGAGGGGGGVSCCNLTNVLTNQCVRIGAGGTLGARAATNTTNGSAGGAGGASCFGSGLVIAGGGAGGGGGCYVANQTTCIVIAGGAGGSGNLAVGNTGGRAVFQCGTGTPTGSACTGSGGGNGGGGGAGQELNSGSGGPACTIFGDILLGKGGDQIGGAGNLPGGIYGAAGGGGCASIISGAACPFNGGAGAPGFVKVISYQCNI